MSPLAENIFYYLEGNSSLAFQIKGRYGKGKTYFVKKILPRELQSNRTQILISLYDISSVREIPQKLLNAFINSKRDNNESITDFINEGYDYIEAKYGCDKDITHLNIYDEKEYVFSVIPKDSVYICFDDVSRFLRNKHTADLFLGFVNELVEILGYKVILIWNSDENKNWDIEKKIEKIIGRSFEYSANISDVVKSFAEETKDPYFISYISKNIKYFLPETYQECSHRVYFENLRSLKFALENFYDIFEMYEYGDSLSDEKTKLRLLYYLTFTIGVSLEYKAGALSEYNKKNIDKYPEEKIELLLDDKRDNAKNLFDVQLFKDDDKPNRKSYRDYSKSFYEFYIDIKFGQSYVFHPQLYSHIISGTELNKVELEADLDSKVTLIPQVLDGNTIVDDIMYRIWTFSDQQFEASLRKLKMFMENGTLRDFNYFVNATIYLYGYREITGFTIDEIKDAVNRGLDIFTKNVNKSIFDDSILDVMEPNVPEDCKWVISAIREKLQIKEQKNQHIDLLQLIDLFKTDIVSFSKELLPENQNTPQYAFVPILKDFPIDTIADGIENITPEGVLNLRSLAKFRCFDCKIIENDFWNAIVISLNKYMKSHNTSLTTLLIKRDLLPYLEIMLMKFQE